MPTASGDVWGSEQIAAYMDEEVDMGENVDMNDMTSSQMQDISMQLLRPHAAPSLLL
ncbi:hypothetical protein B484DRAFT_389915 [Ochromonadaceae sp. CCMP2298]|nr:hypothetical protein B484DRAFT_389915 [Ochromonadaceae sp. CCMP2298]